ncbi:hypothetical protein BC941DRAFT_35872 [Chlamydoabsidia padenii]|nr:hypothetical protein BC941DRAFT_35872 [Chlamydoabsidia padenii]
MGPLQNAQADRSWSAMSVPESLLPSMFTNPLGTNASGPPELMDLGGQWRVVSFTNADVYRVMVADDRIISCTCMDFYTRRHPCKHMHLLKRNTNTLLLGTAQDDQDRPIAMDLGEEEEEEDQQQQQQEQIQEQIVLPTAPPLITNDRLQNVMSLLQTVYHQRQDLGRLIGVANVDEDHLAIIERSANEILDQVDLL